MTTQTAVVQVGNTDNKLTQQRWAEYLRATMLVVQEYADDTYFAGFSRPDRPWQNACWVFDVQVRDLDDLRAELHRLGVRFDQDSIALTIGQTEFVPGTG